MARLCFPQHTPKAKSTFQNKYLRSLDGSLFFLDEWKSELTSKKDLKFNRSRNTWLSGIPAESSLASLCPFAHPLCYPRAEPTTSSQEETIGVGEGMAPRPRSLKYFLLTDGHLTFITSLNSLVLSVLGGWQRPGLSLGSTGAPLKDVEQKSKLQICQAEMAKNNQDHESLGQDAILR